MWLRSECGVYRSTTWENYKSFPNSSLFRILKTCVVSQDATFLSESQKAGASLSCSCASVTGPALGARWQEEREKSVRLCPPSQTIEEDSYRVLGVSLYVGAQCWAPGCLKSMPGDSEEGMREELTLFGGSFFAFWSPSSVHLLLLALHRPQLAAPCSLARIYSCTERERQGETCLFHITQNWTLIAHFIYFIMGKDT